MSTIHTFMVQARERGLSDQQIIARLTAAGWNDEDAKAFLSGDDLVAPSPNNLLDEPKISPVVQADTVKNVSEPTDQKQPIAVVQRYTTRGLEYGIQFLSLGIGAVALGVLLHDLANKAFDPSYSSESWVAMAGATALVSLPIFVVLFLRLKRAEKTTPALRRDSSRRKWVQLSLLVSFLWGISAVIGYLYDLLAGSGSAASRYCDGGYVTTCESIGSAAYTTLQLTHLAVTLLIAGGIFAYYWFDEHKKDMS